MRSSTARPATVGDVLALVGEGRTLLEKLGSELGADEGQVEAMVDQLVTAHLLERVEVGGRPAVQLTEAGRRRQEPEPPAPAAPTDELTDALCAELRLGRPLERACAMCGLPVTVARRWLSEGAAGRSDDYAAFAESVVLARVDAEAAFANALVRTAEVDWQATAALLRAHDAGYTGPTAEDDLATAPPGRAIAGRRDS